MPLSDKEIKDAEHDHVVARAGAREKSSCPSSSCRT